MCTTTEGTLFLSDDFLTDTLSKGEQSSDVAGVQFGFYNNHRCVPETRVFSASCSFTFFKLIFSVRHTINSIQLNIERLGIGTPLS